MGTGPGPKIPDFTDDSIGGTRSGNDFGDTLKMYGKPETPPKNRASLRLECSPIAESDLLNVNSVTAAETRADGTKIEFDGFYDRTTGKVSEGGADYSEIGPKGTGGTANGTVAADLGQKYADKCPLNRSGSRKDGPGL